MGRTQPEIKYILDTVLDHLPNLERVYGKVSIHTIQKTGYNGSRYGNEFLQRNQKENKTQSEYLIILDGTMMATDYETPLQQFEKWICRLAKRVKIKEVFVKLWNREKEIILTDAEPYYGMYEEPSWTVCWPYHEKLPSSPDEPSNWCEYLMWDRAKGSDLPAVLEKKYQHDKMAEVWKRY
jgi:hypothetical protein